MPKTISPPDEFATAMQQLSAEAGKSLPASASKREGSAENDAGFRQLSKELETFTGRLERLEEALSKKIDHLAAAISPMKTVDLGERFKKIDDQLNAIRGTESVNQRVFDSLHD